MAKYSCFVFFLFLDLLCVHGLVLQHPAVVVQPLTRLNETNGDESPLSQNLCGRLVPISTTTSTTELSWEPEPPPEGFSVKLTYFGGARDFREIDVWFVLVANIARTALNRWSLNLRGEVVYPVVSGITMVVASSVDAPRYQTKSIIWTLQQGFGLYVQENFYGSSVLTTSIVSHIGRVETAKKLGTVTLKTSRSAVQDGQGNSSANAQWEHAPEKAASSPLELDKLSQVWLNESSKIEAGFSPLVHNERNTTDLQAYHGIVLRLEYVPNGATFSAESFFATIIKLLVSAAEQDPKTEASGLVTGYNRPYNYTIAVGPTSDATREYLNWEDAIQTLSRLPFDMQGQRRGIKWAELEGKVRRNGLNIAKISIKRGDHSYGANAVYVDGTMGGSDVGSCGYLNDTASA